ncbi:MAG: GNAT family N-acetyltransferase [Longimicrobiaceae bacterium]
MPALRVREVLPGESLRPFIDLSWKFNADDPAWVPPLRRQLRTLLDRRKHPFHRHAEVRYLLASRGGEAVARVAAVVNHRHNDFHGEKTGFFGFFECEDDPRTSRALLGSAGEWLRERGMERSTGPASFSTNEECGLLVEGFEHPPAVLMPHNPPYYARLIEAAGFTKAKDLIAYSLFGFTPPQRLAEGAERLAARAGITVRGLDMKRFRAEVRAIQSIYNSAWSRNWGFVPMTAEEIAFMAKELRPVVDPDLCLIAEHGGEPVGFSLALPDLNQAIKPLNGRLSPWGLLRLLWNRRKIDRARILTLGFRPEFRARGLGTLLYLRTWQAGMVKRYYRGEASWILEDNWEMRRALEKMGGEPYKRYRIYERAL